MILGNKPLILLAIYLVNTLIDCIEAGNRLKISHDCRGCPQIDKEWSTKIIKAVSETKRYNLDTTITAPIPKQKTCNQTNQSFET